MAGSMQPHIPGELQDIPGELQARCPTDGGRLIVRNKKEYVKIEYAESGKGSWTTGGVGCCDKCGRTFRLVTNRLPVEFATVPCPSCGKIVKYHITIDSVQLKEGEFRFKATVTCPHCQKVAVFDKIIKGLRRIKGIKVGPLGVELATGDAD
jgi:DNA-directed RNA polymerase subunit RPC12/RpoP